MNRRWLYCVAVSIAAASLFVREATAEEPEWNLKATIIEACSCPMFCPCYFNDEPTGHAHEGHEMEHFCKFNMGFKVEEGRYGDVDLTGANFWLAGDLGSNFADGRSEWAILTFDKDLSEAQREALVAIVPNLYTVQWDSFETREGEIEWSYDGEVAHATLDGGDSAEIKLRHVAQSLRDEPVVIQNLQYWAADDNEGFVLMPNDVQTWRVADKAFEYKGSNGFMITLSKSSQ